ncbi:MAG: hypothetical protein C0424_05750 [Sphingobacteriaceae bacterium]|nr:hypothetical protein [Sphingobacteriaceae bacterium]
MRKLPLALLATGVWVSIACTQRAKVDVFLPVEGASWDYADSKTIEVKVEDTAALNDVYINVRHAGDYEWQNLYVKIRIYSPQGDSTSELVSIPLTSQEGKWIGSGLGSLRTMRHLYKEQIQFKQLGTYRFVIDQYMRVNPLAGIHDVGMRVSQ